MHTSAPKIYVENVAARPSKRRRLDLSEPVLQEDQSAIEPEFAVVARSAPCSTGIPEEISEDALVCFGMVGDLSRKYIAAAHILRF
jgi:hypothetical protein